MVLLTGVRKIPIPEEKRHSFPFSTRVVRTLESLTFDTPVTFFVGENGSGKSTLLEGIAAVCRLPIVGSNNLNDDETLRYASVLGEHLRLSWSIKRHRGFFLRAEDFFGFTKRLHTLRSELTQLVAEFDRDMPDSYGKTLAIGSLRNQIDSLKQRYGVDLNAHSHGESFLKLFQTRIVRNGLYLLDEPETPLSPTRQMTLLAMIHDAVKEGSQFIVVTHSPIIMAYPDATILDFNSSSVRRVSYDDIEHVHLYRDFLLHKEQYLHNLLS